MNVIDQQDVSTINPAVIRNRKRPLDISRPLGGGKPNLRLGRGDSPEQVRFHRASMGQTAAKLKGLVVPALAKPCLMQRGGYDQVIGRRQTGLGQGIVEQTRQTIGQVQSIVIFKLNHRFGQSAPMGSDIAGRRVGRGPVKTFLADSVFSLAGGEGLTADEAVGLLKALNIRQTGWAKARRLLSGLIRLID